MNGLYWGIYNLCERPDDAFAVAYLGGDREDWDTLNAGEVHSGDAQKWAILQVEAELGLEEPADFLRIQGLDSDGSRNPAYDVLLNMNQYIRFMLVNIWAGNWGWPHNNYWAARRQGADSEGFLFYAWGFENSMGCNRVRAGLNDEAPRALVANEGVGIPHQALLSNQVYRLKFADEVHRAFHHGGPLDPASLIPGYSNLAARVEQSLVCESARWGDMHSSTPLDPGLSGTGCWTPICRSARISCWLNYGQRVCTQRWMIRDLRWMLCRSMEAWFQPGPCWACRGTGVSIIPWMALTPGI